MIAARVELNLHPLRPQLPILLFHNIAVIASGLVVSSRALEGLIQQLKWRGYHFCTPADVIAWSDDYNAMPQKSIWLTFDDGYRNCHTYGTPILRKYGVRATIAPITSLIGVGDKITAADISDMQDVWDFALHGHNGHSVVQAESDGTTGPFYGNRKYLVDVSRLETDDEFKARVRTDMETSQDFIEALLGYRPNVMIWPYGHYGTTLSDPTYGHANDPTHVPGLLEEVMDDLGVECGLQANPSVATESGRVIYDWRLDSKYHAPRKLTGSYEDFDQEIAADLAPRIRLFPGETADANWPKLCNYGSGYLGCNGGGRLMRLDQYFVPIETSWLPTDMPVAQGYPVGLDNGDVWVSFGDVVKKIDMAGRAVVDSFGVWYCYNLVTDGIYGYIVTEGGAAYRVDFAEKTMTKIGDFPAPPLSAYSYYGTAYWGGYLYAHDRRAGTVSKMRISDGSLIKQAQIPIRFTTASLNRLAGPALAEDELVFWLAGYRNEIASQLVRVIVG